ncbi:hypothetical protein AAG570_000179 [Ranatra chinensis]|uniref:Vanin C-terminal domain-containing protein n=1 Tax=Ranatra chinensis TaxID=642074 RepID=A0ABD0Z6S2_9HEMI
MGIEANEWFIKQIKCPRPKWTLPDYTVGSGDYSYFDTDMGVRFGLMSDEELLSTEDKFRHFMATNNITKLVLPSAFVNRIPFLTALQEQWAWSYFEDKALLASGLVDRDSEGGLLTGSGLYDGRGGGPVEYTWHASQQHMLIQTMPKTTAPEAPHLPQYWDLPRTQTGESKRVLRDVKRESATKKKSLEGPTQRETLKAYETALLKPQLPQVNPNDTSLAETRWNFNETLCQNGTCCRFNVTLVAWYSLQITKTVGVDKAKRSVRSPGEYERGVYRAVLTDSRQDMRGDGGGVGPGVLRVRRCAVVACLDERLESCGSLDTTARTPSTSSAVTLVGAQVESMSVEAEFPGRPNTLALSGAGPILLSPDRFKFNVSGEMSQFGFDHPVPSLVTAGIERYDRTELPPTSPYQETWTMSS